jgi:hypothetical protein
MLNRAVYTKLIAAIVRADHAGFFSTAAPN